MFGLFISLVLLGLIGNWLIGRGLEFRGSYDEWIVDEVTMAKIRHGHQVPSPVLVGFLFCERIADKDKIMRLAAALVMSEMGGRDINRMAQLYQADLGLVNKFKLPERLTAPKVWEWRFEGYNIIREAAGYRMPATRDSLSGFVITNIFKKKLQEERKIHENAIRAGLKP